MPDEIAAVALDGRLRTIDAQERRGYAEKGLIVLEVEQRLLWRFMLDGGGNPFTSLTRWVREAAPFGYSTCFAAKEDVKELLKDIPMEKIVGVPRCNLITLKMLSSEVRRRPEVLADAKNKEEKDFISQIQQSHPEQHIENRRLIHLNPTKSASAVIEQAIKLAMSVEGVTSREQAMEAIAMEYIHQHQEAEAI